MRYIFFMFFAVLPGIAQSSESYPYSKTSISDGARYEIIQSTLAAKYTFRLDKFTGRVWQVVRTQEDHQTWQEVPVNELPKIVAPTGARFQLFISGVAARFTYLLDTGSGRTWMFVSDGQGTNSWEPLKE